MLNGSTGATRCTWPRPQDNRPPGVPRGACALSPRCASHARRQQNATPGQAQRAHSFYGERPAGRLWFPWRLITDYGNRMAALIPSLSLRMGRRTPRNDNLGTHYRDHSLSRQRDSISGNSPPQDCKQHPGELQLISRLAKVVRVRLDKVCVGKRHCQAVEHIL